MVIDTSAIVAILAAEPEAEHFAALIEAVPRPLVSAASMVEAGIVLGPEHAATLDAFVAAAGLEVVPVDEAQSRAAREAHRRFGRGSPSRVRLTFGDCFSYGPGQDERPAAAVEGGRLRPHRSGPCECPTAPLA